MDFNVSLFEETINEILPGLTVYVRDVNLPMVVSMNMKNFSRDIKDALRVIVELDNKGVIVKSHNGDFDSRQMDKLENLEFSRILDISEFLEGDQEPDEGMVMQ